MLSVRKLIRTTFAAVLVVTAGAVFAQDQDITCDTVLTAQDPLSAYTARAAACLQPTGLLFERNTAQAIADADFVIERDAANAEAFAMRGQARLWQREFGQSIADLTTALILQPQNVDWLTFRAFVMLQVQDRTGAIADFSRALAVEPTNEALWLERSRLHELNGDLKSALADAEQAAALNPNNAAALQRIGDIYYVTGNDQLALEAYRRYLEVAVERSPLVNARILILERRLGNG